MHIQYMAFIRIFRYGDKDMASVSLRARDPVSADVILLYADSIVLDRLQQ